MIIATAKDLTDGRKPSGKTTPDETETSKTVSSTDTHSYLEPPAYKLRYSYILGDEPSIQERWTWQIDEDIILAMILYDELEGLSSWAQYFIRSAEGIFSYFYGDMYAELVLPNELY